VHFGPRCTLNSRRTAARLCGKTQLSIILSYLQIVALVCRTGTTCPSVCPHLGDPVSATEVPDRFASNSVYAFVRKRCPAIASFVEIGCDGLALFSDVNKCVPMLSVFLCGSGLTSVRETCQQSGRALLSFLKVRWGKNYTFLTDVNENPAGRA